MSLRRTTFLGLLSASLLLAANAESAGPTLLDAVQQSPALAAAQQRIAAARARLPAAGQLADPQVEGMASRGNMVDGNSTMWELTIRQPLPKQGERDADRQRAHAAVAMMEADYAMLAGDLAADVAIALAEHAGALARIQLLDTQLGRLDAVLQSVETRLASGGPTRISDRLAVQSRIAAMQLAVERERRLADDAASDVRARLAFAPDIPLPAYAAPSPERIDPVNASALLAASARQREADAMKKMARARAKPMTAVGLRLEREQTRMGNDDTVGLAFMSEIPWRSRRSSRADVRAAEAERLAAQSDAAAARYKIDATLSRVARAERLAESARRLGADTRERLGAEYDSLIRSAGASTATSMTSPVFMAADLLEKITETELQIIEAETAARVARAELWRHAPADRFFVLPSSSENQTP